MKNIRRRTFETNSSSMHSISICDSTCGMYESITPNDDGVITLRGGQFGCEWEKYNDASTKANYAAVFAYGDRYMTDMLVQVIKDHTGAKEVNLEFSSHSGIDHQPFRDRRGNAYQAFAFPETLKNWIFNPGSWLFTGNDNGTEPSNFYDVDRDIVYTHELSVEGTADTIRFSHQPIGEELEGSLEKLMHRHPLCGWHYNAYSYIPYGLKQVSGTGAYSLAKIAEGKLILVKTNPVYSKNKFLGYRVLKTKEISFKITKL